MLTCSHQEAQILIVSAGFTSLPDILQVELSHINPLSTAIYNKTIVSPNNNSKNLSSWNSRKQSRDLPWLAKMAMLHQHKPTACQSWRLMQIAKFLPVPSPNKSDHLTAAPKWRRAGAKRAETWNQWEAREAHSPPLPLQCWAHHISLLTRH